MINKMGLSRKTDVP